MSFLPKENSIFRIECWKNDLPPKKRNHPISGPLRDKNLLGIRREFVWEEDVRMKESYSYSRNRMKIANPGAGMSSLPKENSTFRIECWRNDPPQKNAITPLPAP